MKNDRLLKALRREPVDRTPVWLMRQAGRYLPEYRKIREQAGDFMTLCRTPELACQVTLQPIERFGFDAAILFSDILTIPDAMGLGLYFEPGEGPCFRQPLRSVADIQRLHAPEVETDLAYVTEAARLVAGELDGRIPLIGFSGSPWTLACYMVEGGSSRNFTRIKRLMYDEPQALEQLLDLLTDCVTEYLAAQVKAGAQALQIFDTWGGILTLEQYKRFSLSPMWRICTGLRERCPDVPIILFTKNARHWIEAMALVGADALSIDWNADLRAVRELVGDQVALQGNLDPSALFAKPENVRREVKKILARYGHGNGHVFNLGHGILPETPLASVEAMVQAVHELSPLYHQDLRT